MIYFNLKQFNSHCHYQFPVSGLFIRFFFITFSSFFCQNLIESLQMIIRMCNQSQSQLCPSHKRQRLSKTIIAISLHLWMASYRNLNRLRLRHPPRYEATIIIQTITQYRLQEQQVDSRIFLPEILASSYLGYFFAHFALFFCSFFVLFVCCARFIFPHFRFPFVICFFVLFFCLCSGFCDRKLQIFITKFIILFNFV